MVDLIGEAECDGRPGNWGWWREKLTNGALDALHTHAAEHTRKFTHDAFCHRGVAGSFPPCALHQDDAPLTLEGLRTLLRNSSKKLLGDH